MRPTFLGSVTGIVACAVLAASSGACGGVPTPAAGLVRTPEYNPAQQTKCKVAASQSRPLIVEWPSADRASVEAQARQGLVVVHYTGCEMEMLPACHVKDASYKYIGTTMQHDEVVMRDADELYANLPLGAPKLEGRLERGGQLAVSMTIVGTYSASKSATTDDLEGRCTGATHVVRGLTVGSFDFYQEGDAAVRAEVGGIAGGKSSARRESLNSAGNPTACTSATTKDEEPPNNCGALLRLEVEELTAPGALGTKPVGQSDAMQARVRVAARCYDSEVLTPTEGLVVLLDGANEVLPHSAVRSTWSEERQRTVSEYVTYPVAPGRHRATLMAPGCAARTVEFEAMADHPVTISGALPPPDRWNDQGPAGAPSGFRIEGGAWFTSTNQRRFRDAINSAFQVQSTGVPSSEDLALAGLELRPEFVTRFFRIGLDLRWATGKTNGSGELVRSTARTIESGNLGTTVQAGNIALRPGVRIPLDWAAVSAGPGLGGSMTVFEGTHTTARGALLLPAWVSVDAQPLCDLALSVTGERSFLLYGDNDYLSLLAGVAYQPNGRCRRERRGEFDLRAEAK